VNGRVPPHDLDAEAAVLSAILLNRDALARVVPILKPEHFYSDANGRVYEVAQESGNGNPKSRLWALTTADFTAPPRPRRAQ